MEVANFQPINDSSVDSFMSSIPSNPHRECTILDFLRSRVAVFPGTRSLGEERSPLCGEGFVENRLLVPFGNSFNVHPCMVANLSSNKG